MRFYTVSDEYLAFLQKIDSKVPNSEGSGYKVKKLFVGIVLEVGTHKFLAPLSSYKINQDSIPSSACTCFKLHERTNPDNKLGIINLKYMIPVPDSELKELDMEAQEAKYKKMLLRQYEFIKANREDIIKRATKLYAHVTIKRSEYFVRVACDFPRLVDGYKNFKKAEKSE